MSTRNLDNINLLPFDELVKLHKNGQLNQYAQEITQFFIDTRAGLSSQRRQRLEYLSFRLTAIRKRHPRGLKAFLEINKLIQDNNADFEQRIVELLRGDMPVETEASNPITSTQKTGKVLHFPLPLAEHSAT